MIKSMTGFGKATCELPEKKINIEIRALNSKQLDLNMRLPGIYREKDLILRNEISQSLQRGKIDVSFHIDSYGPDRVTSINPQVFENYYKQISELNNNFDLGTSNDILRTIISLPETIKTEQNELDNAEWEKIFEAFKEAINNINSFRAQEGKSLEKEVSGRIKNIDTLLSKVEPFEKERINKIRQRIIDQLNELDSKISFDQNRFEQEMIYYLEKIDITEEKVRLKNHLEYFIETINKEDIAGKKLGFISQEIGREINTLGSKANDPDLQKIVIQMKDELEKIKEQNLNIL